MARDKNGFPPDIRDGWGPADQSRKALWIERQTLVEEEIAIALAHVQKNEKEVKLAYEDIIWALINTKEFLFNH